MSRKAAQNLLHQADEDFGSGQRRNRGRRRSRASGPQGRGQDHSGHGTGRTGQHRLVATSERTAPFSREIYVKANFGFALGPLSKARAERGKDSFDWEEVRSVFAKSEEMASCPLCLDKVTVPRMTACGHIFCMVCLLRLFTYADSSVERCPLCFAFIQTSDLRRVLVQSVPDRINIGDTIEMALLKRPHFGTVPVAVDQNTPKAEYVSPNLPLTESTRALFSRICQETSGFAEKHYVKESEELRAQYNECHGYGDTLGMDLTVRAVAELQKAHTDNWGMGGAESGSAPPSKAPKGSGKNVTGDDVYFYQIADTRYVFLSVFNVKCLLHEYGEKVAFPRRLAGPVLEEQTVVLTPDIVKRFAYLAHLPLHATVVFIELDLNAQLSSATVAHFAEDMKKRARERAARKRAEEQHERTTLERQRKAVAADGAYMGYGIDYKDYMRKQREHEAEVERQLAHAFDASLSGKVLSAEEQASLESVVDEASAKSKTIWGTNTVSALSIMKSSSHFPSLSAAAPSPPGPKTSLAKEQSSMPRPVAGSAAAWGSSAPVAAASRATSGLSASASAWSGPSSGATKPKAGQAKGKKGKLLLSSSSSGRNPSR